MKNRKRFITAGVIAVLAIAGLYVLKSYSSHKGDPHAHHKMAPDSKVLPETNNESLFQVQLALTNQDGVKKSFSSLKGTKTVLTMAYTSCTYTCPLMIKKMKAIENAISPKKINRVKFVLMSLDSDFDYPQELRKLATKRGLNMKNWELFHLSANDVAMLAALLNVKYRKNNDRDFSHSINITILDENGYIVRSITRLEENVSDIVREASL
jgi:protein SCO1